MSGETPTAWWHDSGIPSEIDVSLEQGAVGVTTNPVLTYRALTAEKISWQKEIQEILQGMEGSDRAIALTGIVVKKAAALLSHVNERSQGRSGYVCSQVNPATAGDREAMLGMAKTMSTFGENVAIKLPATAAGLDVMEECVVNGMHTTITVSFTLPQVLAIAERYQKAKGKAEATGKKPGRCFAVVMIGRLDDYLRDVALDMNAKVEEGDIKTAGLAVVKRAYSIYRKEGYDTELIIAAMRGAYHITDLVGSKMILSIHPKYQDPKLFENAPKEELIDKPVDQKSIERLSAIPEFIRAYEPTGMQPDEFLSYGATQRTLCQFSEIGWKLLEGFEL